MVPWVPLGNFQRPPRHHHTRVQNPCVHQKVIPCSDCASLRRNGVLSAMSTCSYCGAETRPGDRFCLSCGKPIAVPDVPSSFETEEATMLGSPLSAATPNASQQQDDGYEGATMMAPPHSRTVENPGQF